MLDDDRGVVDVVLVTQLLEELSRAQRALLALLALLHRQVRLGDVQQRVRLEVLVALLDAQLQGLLRVLLSRLAIVVVDAEARRHQQQRDLLDDVADGFEEHDRFHGGVDRILQKRLDLQPPLLGLLELVHVEVHDLQGGLRLFLLVLIASADRNSLLQHLLGLSIVVPLLVQVGELLQRARLAGGVPDLSEELLSLLYALRCLRPVPDVARHDLGKLEVPVGGECLALVVLVTEQRYGFPGFLDRPDGAPVSCQDLGHIEQRTGRLLIPTGLLVELLALVEIRLSLVVAPLAFVDLNHHLQHGRLPRHVARLPQQRPRVQQAVQGLLALAAGPADLSEQLHGACLALHVPGRARQLRGLLRGLQRLLAALQRHLLHRHAPQRRQLALHVPGAPRQLLLLPQDVQRALWIVDLDDGVEQRGDQLPVPQLPRERERLIQRLQRHVDQAFGLVGAGNHLVRRDLPQRVAVLPELCHRLLGEATCRLGVPLLSQHDTGNLLLGGSLPAEGTTRTRHVRSDLGKEVRVLVLLQRDVQLRDEQEGSGFLVVVPNVLEELKGLVRQL
mmetsp:Transcript_45531/g.131905  ORF Transcript_45531/g.131905 Transcript_45531/m.131905 type:complete len:561 (+) Transcript_45531:604-2286(+)